MDIPGLSMAMAQSRLQTDFGVAMLSKSLDNVQETGDNLTKMMELSVNPDLGANIDISL
ncbi:putative motility protein [bacterium C-53]|mgnify:CR=1 FL=1|nr:putative motility protein [Lachnospiraceae bacterium]NBI01667.1 putative motility protein [Lachnospiraceae bacterium]RKJ12959.1 putative motility protein [bacterium C-53]